MVRGGKSDRAVEVPMSMLVPLAAWLVVALLCAQIYQSLSTKA
jgi:hypothetical protein